MADLPHIVHSQEGLEVHHGLDQHGNPYDLRQTYTPRPLKPKGAEQRIQENTQSRRILGLQRNAFCFVTVLAVIVVGAAIDGGVGDSLAVQNAK